jgi:8-oxo-dGTP diphosphatase
MQLNIENRIVQKIFLLNDINEVLLLKRSHYGKRKGEWDLPGGRLDEGETLEQGLAREIKEEIGVDSATASHTLFYSCSTLRKDEKEPYNYVLSLYVGEISAPTIMLSPEHDEFMWVALDRLVGTLQHPLQIEAAERLIANKLLRAS